MGISIVLYRIKETENTGDSDEMALYMNRSKSVNLYNVTQDLLIILMNKYDPFTDENALPYKMLFGNYIDVRVGKKMINGFVSASEVVAICNWLFENKLLYFQGFARMYNRLGKESLDGLASIGADDISHLYFNYFFPLTKFYFDALNEKQSIVFCCE